MKCPLEGLWLLNRDCSVVMSVCSECGICAGYAGIRPYLAHLPAVDSSGVYHLAFPHYLNCESISHEYRRICPCHTVNKWRECGFGNNTYFHYMKTIPERVLILNT